jgi:hypothetical protein
MVADQICRYWPELQADTSRYGLCATVGGKKMRDCNVSIVSTSGIGESCQADTGQLREKE